MAKNKASRQPETAAVPVANGRKPVAAPERPSARPQRPGTPSVRRDLISPLMLLLALACTAFIWVGTPFAAYARWDSRWDPTTRLGLVLTCLIWTVTMVGLLGIVRSRRTARRLQAILAHEEVVQARLAPNITEEQSGLRMRYVSAWLVAMLGIAASVVLWHNDVIERAVGEFSTLVVGATISVCLALAVAANTINRLKTRRLTRDFRAALTSERLALETLGSLDVMISACLPNGERTRFNERFLQLVGKTQAQMQGRGWLEEVHVNDRQAAVDLVSKPLGENERSREHDLCVRHRNGSFVWLRETLMPRFDTKGNLIEFICTAMNITTHVENEAALDKQIGALKIDLDRATAELLELKNEFSKTKTSRNRFETGLTEAREEVKNLQQALNKAETSLEKTRLELAEKLKEAQTEARDRIKAVEDEAAERVRKMEEGSETRVGRAEEALKIARQELQSAVAENKKLGRACETLQAEVGTLRHQGGDVKEQVARHMKEMREAKEKIADAQASEAQHRGRNIRLTQRCEELEAKLASKDAALNARSSSLSAARDEAQQARVAAALEVESRLQEVSPEALATHLRKQLDGLERMTGELLAQSLDGPAKDAANNTAATVRAMCDLVDQVLSGAAPRAAARSAAGTSFDLGRTAQGVRELLEHDAAAKGVKLEVEVASNVRPVYGDEIEVRTALMSLTGAALQLVSDGTLTMRLKEDVNTAAHSTIRCELTHGSARVKNDALEAALAIKSTDKAMPDAVKQPVAHQAAKAWRTIRVLQGQHGLVLPAEGGFSVWFTFTLGRPAASASLRLTPSGLAETAQADTPSPAESTGESNGSRSLPRMPQESLTCTLGEVVELGADSMRVFCAKAPKRKEVTVKLENVDLDKELRAEVSWSKKMSGRQHDVGLKFLGLTAEEQKTLLRIAMQHRKVTTMLGAEQVG